MPGATSHRDRKLETNATKTPFSPFQPPRDKASGDQDQVGGHSWGTQAQVHEETACCCCQSPCHWAGHRLHRPWPRGHPLLPVPQSHSEAPVKATVLQAKPIPQPRLLHPRIHTLHLSLLQGPGRPNNKDGQMDAWMDRVTGFQHLQKADSQAPMPGVPPNQRLHVVEALVGRPAACKVPQGIPGVSPAL